MASTKSLTESVFQDKAAMRAIARGLNLFDINAGFKIKSDDKEENAATEATYVPQAKFLLRFLAKRDFSLVKSDAEGS